MECQVEHANLRVGDVEETIRFLTTAMPNFRVRGGKKTDAGKWEWVHVGPDSSYLALSEDKGEKQARVGPGLNHVGFAVDDAKAVRARLEAAGYEEGYKAEAHRFRTRVYFIDGCGVEWEFVEYFSEALAERNDYGDVE